MTILARICLLCLLLPAGCRAPQPSPRPRALAVHALHLDTDPRLVDRVMVVGELPGSPLTMQRESPGRWRCTVEGLVRGRSYRYQFRVHRRDLNRWFLVSDPTAWLLDASIKRRSLLLAGAPLPPRPPAITPPPLRDLVIYELCPREFVDPDTPYARPAATPGARGPGRVLQRITAKIRSGYFEKLGVNALELMPLTASSWTTWKRQVPERDPWGYSPLSWYAINGDYGSPADLAELVTAAHRHGLLVLVDFSLDHGYGGDKYGLLTDLHPDWRNPKPTNPWGLLELDLSKPRLRRFLKGALRRFLVDYGVDGFRMDWTEKTPWQHWAYFTKEIRRVKPGAILISENPVRELVTRAGFDSTWDFFFQWEAPLLLRQVFTNFDGVHQRQVDTQEKLVENLTRWKSGPHAPPGPLVRYIESHDLPRIARPRVRWQHGGDQLQDVDGDGRTPDWLEHGGQAASRLGATLLATVPGALMLFAGQEFGSADRLQWAYDPLDWGTFDRQTFAHYSKVLHLRRRLAALRSDDLRVLLSAPPRHLLIFSRGSDPERADDDTAVGAFNFGAAPLRGVEVRLPAEGNWRDALTGRRLPPGRIQSITLPAQGAALLVLDPQTRE